MKHGPSKTQTERRAIEAVVRELQDPESEISLAVKAMLAMPEPEPDPE